MELQTVHHKTAYKTAEIMPNLAGWRAGLLLLVLILLLKPYMTLVALYCCIEALYSPIEASYGPCTRILLHCDPI